MKKFIFLFLLFSAQFAYGEEGLQYGWGDNPDAEVMDALAVYVYTTTGTDPFKLGYAGSVNDFMFIDIDDNIYGYNPRYLISEVYIQQLGDSMVILADYGTMLRVYRVLPDTKIHYGYAVP